MIIQRALKGISRLDPTDVARIFAEGITCNWWRKENPLPNGEIPSRLIARNLEWHQNRYNDPDPLDGNEPFRLHTPFISLTAGTVERDDGLARNFVTPAWQVALQFATDQWRVDGCIFYCYVFVIGRPCVAHRAFAEELRELNVYSGFSPFQPEGEVTAKIVVPPEQIEKCEFYSISDVVAATARGVRPVPITVVDNPLYKPPEDIANLRDVLL